MFRAGTIAGRFVDVNGDPVEMTPVQALRGSRSAHGRPQNRGFAQTHDLGEVRIAHLEQASYIVCAPPHRDTLLDMTDLSGQTNAPDTQAVPTFYPGVQS